MRFFSILLAVFSFTAAALADSPRCDRPAGSRPDPKRAAGLADPRNPIEHVIVIMQENHSFDNYYGALNSPKYYGAEVDGVSARHANRNHDGTVTSQFKDRDLCTDDPAHGWNDAHHDFHGGAMDGFVTTNDFTDEKSHKHHLGGRVMGYYDGGDLPYYYALANTFAIADRYFCSALTQTFPNRFYLYAATSFGNIRNEVPGNSSGYAQKTIFDELDQFGVSWKYYSDGEGYLKLFQPLYLRDYAKIQPLAHYYADLANGTLPKVAFLETSFNDQGEDEHPGADVQVGQQWVAEQLNPLFQSSAWKSSAVFLTYDENGGFYDHVAPPAACAPDKIAPNLKPNDMPGKFDRLGLRVPFTAVSPYAKHHYVSHQVYDHTSILKFIETKFNLPALTARDANADGLADLFDFAHPVFAAPALPSATVDASRACQIGNNLKVPPQPVKIVSAQSGRCVALPEAAALGKPLVLATCDGSAGQSFQFTNDHHGTFGLRSVSSKLCAEIDWQRNGIFLANCATKEDQGLEISYGSPVVTYQLGGWHGDFCLHDAALGAPLKFGSCNVADDNPEESFDFYLE